MCVIHVAGVRSVGEDAGQRPCTRARECDVAAGSPAESALGRRDRKGDGDLCADCCCIGRREWGLMTVMGALWTGAYRKMVSQEKKVWGSGLWFRASGMTKERHRDSHALPDDETHIPVLGQSGLRTSDFLRPLEFEVPWNCTLNFPLFPGKAIKAVQRNPPTQFEGPSRVDAPPTHQRVH